MEELNEKLTEIQFLLASNIEAMKKIVAEANDPKKRAEEAQILIEASKSINSTTESIKGSINVLNRQIEGFKPTVEVKHYDVNVKKPLVWILSAVGAILISFSTCYWFYSKWQNEKALKMKYKAESDLKDWNYMKYKYLEIVNPDVELRDRLKAFDKIYNDDFHYCDSLVFKRERELAEAREAAREAELRQAESKRLQQRADSLQNAQ